MPGQVSQDVLHTDYARIAAVKVSCSIFKHMLLHLLLVAFNFLCLQLGDDINQVGAAFLILQILDLMNGFDRIVDRLLPASFLVGLGDRRKLVIEVTINAGDVLLCLLGHHIE